MNADQALGRSALTRDRLSPSRVMLRSAIGSARIPFSVHPRLEEDLVAAIVRPGIVRTDELVGVMTPVLWHVCVSSSVAFSDLPSIRCAPFRLAHPLSRCDDR